MDLMQLYETEVEKPFGKAGERSLSDQEIIEFSRKLRSEGKVLGRCVEYLEENPRLAYIGRQPFKKTYEEILSKTDAGVLEVGCFLGNEVRQFAKDGFQGYVAGVDRNPWHMLVGFLLHNDSPRSYRNVEFVVGDVCDMRTIPDSRFDYVYSNGLIHSLVIRDKVPVHLREVHRVSKTSALMFGCTFTDNPHFSDRLTRLTKEELLQECADAGFEASFLEEEYSTKRGKLLFYFAKKL